MRSIALLAGLAVTTAASAQPVTTISGRAPTFDRWNYPFNATPGSRPTASTFAAFVPGQFDDRDAQVLLSFVTNTDILPGQGAANYQILSATVTGTIATESTADFAYDPTYDSFATYLPNTDPSFQADADAGRPVEIFGTGFRNNLNAFAYGDSFAYGFGAPTAEGIRNAFNLGDTPSGLGDVSNNVRDRFDTTPFGIGQSTKNPGDLIVGGDSLTFDLDLSNPDVVGYIANSLNAGILSLSVSSLHTASQTGAGAFPIFATNESITTPGFTLDLEVRVVPAPAGVAVAGLGLLGLTRRRRAS